MSCVGNLILLPSHVLMKCLCLGAALQLASAAVLRHVALEPHSPHGSQASSMSLLHTAVFESMFSYWKGIRASSNSGMCTSAFVVGALVSGVFVYVIVRWVYPMSEAPQDTETGANISQRSISQTTIASNASPRKPPVDYDSLVRLLMQQTAQKVGPTLAKGQAIRSILEDRVEGLRTKARSMVLNELNGTAASLFQAIDAEEAMLLLDWDNAVAAHFPPLATLLAGLFSPAILMVSLSVFVLQIVVVLLPIVLLCSWAVLVDRHASCSGIPTIFLWVYLQLALTLVLLISNIVLSILIRRGQKELAAKRDEMQEKLEKTGVFNDSQSVSDMGVSGARELFVCHSVLLQQALVIEDSVRKSRFSYINGIGTLLWTVLNAWTFVIAIGWTFVPGMVAFHPLASPLAGDVYCSAWATVFAVRLSCVLTVFFFFPNLLTVVRWFTDHIVNSPRFGKRVLNQATTIDNTMGGLPLAQLLVKAFFLRGSSEVASAQLAVTLHDKEQLEKDRIRMQESLAQMDAKIQVLDERATAMMERPDDFGGEDFLANVQKLEAMKDSTVWLEKGKLSVEEAKKKAEELQETTTKDLERMINQVLEAVENIRCSEEYQTALAMGSEVALQAQEGLQQGMTRATDAAQQLKELHDSGELHKGLAEAGSQLHDNVTKATEELSSRVRTVTDEK